MMEEVGMDDSFPQQRSGTRRQIDLSAVWQSLGRLGNWLARIAQLTQLTEEEQDEAGIHPAHPRDV